MELVQDNWQYVAGAIVVANVVTMFTNRDWDNKVMKFTAKVLNVAALNILKNRNAK